MQVGQDEMTIIYNLRHFFSDAVGSISNVLSMKLQRIEQNQ